MEGIPSDVQELAFWAFEEAEGEMLGNAALEAGLARALGQRQEGYRDRINGIRSPVQGRIVLALARGPEPNPYALDFTNRIGYTNTTGIRKALEALETEELIEREGSGAWRLSDPLMRQWLGRRRADVISLPPSWFESHGLDPASQHKNQLPVISARPVEVD
ncbi:MAG: hypothetical protein ACYDGR_05705 [Candidatus Dormibacteria bacterium]